MPEKTEIYPFPANPAFPSTAVRRTSSADARASTAIPAGDIEKSWALRHLKDTREDVIEQIRGAVTVPEWAKSFLVSAINQSHPKSRLISVDAHCQVVQLPGGKVKHLGCWDISEI